MIIIISIIVLGTPIKYKKSIPTTTASHIRYFRKTITYTRKKPTAIRREGKKHKRSTPCPSTSAASLPSLGRQTPVVLVREAVMQWLDPLGLLALGKTIGGRHFKESGCGLDQPLRLDRCRTVHVLLRREDQGVVDDMFGWLAE